ncbi:MAG: hypothetical protein ACI9ZT_000952 [Gammaproteobacteria bacterium]|jgi:hypothetical protein
MINWLTKSFLILLVISLTVFLFAQTASKENVLLGNSNANDHDVNDDDEEKILIVDGYKAIQLDEDVVEVAGLKFEELESISIRPEFIAYAEVLDIAPLVSLKTDYQILLAEKKTLQNDLFNHNKILQRAEALHKSKGLSTRDLEINRADRDLKASALNANNTRINSFVYKAKSTWGDILSGLVFNDDKQSEFDMLASNQRSLILLSLPKNMTLNHQKQKVFVSNLNQRESAQAVSYIDQAKQVSSPLYGESYIYALESQKVRTGMSLFAWIEDGRNTTEGYFIPERAVIWYANEPWAYVKHGEDVFIRKPLGTAKKISNGWLLEDKILIGEDLLVTDGGQTLLSEEFKWAIPDENDD